MTKKRENLKKREPKKRHDKKKREPKKEETTRGHPIHGVLQEDYSLFTREEMTKNLMTSYDKDIVLDKQFKGR